MLVLFSAPYFIFLMTTRKIILAVIAVIIVAGAVYAAKLIIDNKTAPKSRVI